VSTATQTRARKRTCVSLLCRSRPGTCQCAMVLQIWMCMYMWGQGSYALCIVGVALVEGRKARV
jgi:hypothetical protein